MDTTNEIVHESKAGDPEIKTDKMVVCAALKLNVDDWCLQFVCDWCDKQLNTFASLLKHYLLVHMCVSDEEAQNVYTKHVGDFNANDTDTTDACDEPENKIILKEENEDVEFCCNDSLIDDIEFPEAETILVEGLAEIAGKTKVQISEKFNCSQCGKTCRQTLYQTTCCVNCYSATNPFECFMCGVLLKHKSHISKHMKRKHKAEMNDPTKTQKPTNFNKTFKCNICDKSYSRQSGLNYHRRLKHRVTVTIDDDVQAQNEQSEAANQQTKPVGRKYLRFNCEKCGKSCFQTPTQIKICRKCNGINKPYACHLCDAKFADKSNLNLHVKRHTGIKSYLCPICGKAFVSSNDHKRHIKQTHNKERPFCCDECGKRYPTQGRLNLHLRRHRNERNYECPECGKCFYETGSLNTHMQIHSKDKPFACHICELKFPVKVYLTEHLKVHSNFKAYKCEVCSEAFAQIAGLCSHRKRHHPDFNRKTADTN